MNNYTQLCVWPGTVLGEGSVQDLENWFFSAMGVRVQYKCEQVTNPDLDESGNPIANTGGRNDLFFYIHTEDVTKFAIPRFQMGIRWWEDVVKYNDNSHLYTTSFLEENPTTW